MTMPDFDIRSLLRLLAVNEAGSFAQAARTLGVSRQAIHRSVDTLEGVAGGPLFDRTARELRPTTLGRRLLNHAVDLRHLDRAVRGALEQGRDEPAGSLQLTAPPLFAETVLSEAAASFSARYPSVALRVTVDGQRTNLLRDDLDLMIRVGAPPEDHFATKLGLAELVLCASPDHISATGVPKHPRDLADYPLLAFGRQPASSWTLIRGDTTCSIDVEPRLVSDSPGVVIASCLEGAGILLCPELAAASALASGRLVRVLPEWSAPPVGIWAVYGHRTADDPTLRAFLDELRLIAAAFLS